MGPFSVVRWVRAASFAATCAVLATLGHLVGGGSFDQTAALGGFLLLLLPALALTGRERTLASILPATAASQVILHTLLALSAERHAAAHHAGMDVMVHAHPAASPGFGMLLVHAASVLLTSVWLRWLEEALCSLVRQLAGWVLRPLLVLCFLAAGVITAPSRSFTHARRAETERIRLFLRYVLVLRGPPGGQVRPAVVA
ncbi:hypothetical protein E1292_41695 [Nonomuraea deserti]|uniref:Uncharacterized protein n=1 Tax=Nonomuraea deserti TaxID=1848322 RepID=A0A4R4V060_9ACTN|nr:hypothetical protein [Nonomuraea deserti]TDC92489.1 hypothetical protein E1292_41695 [Nonomuraea deserti]